MPSMSSSADTVPSGVASGNETASKANAAHLLQDQAEQDQFLLGKALFDARQYERAAYYLENCAGPKATFLRLYSLYLAGEKRKNEKLAEFRDAHERPKIVNDMASEIRDELAKNRDKLDGFGLLGLIYSNQKSRLARDVLLESVKTYPYNWSAWQCLAVCLNTRELVEGFMPRLPQGIMRHVFLAHVTVESPPSSIDSGDLFNLHYQVLRQVFPTSPFVISMQAMRHYHTREFEEAHAVFSELEERDPYHLDHADIHSNILYVMEDRPQLGTLAHRCSVIDVYRPETCCVIGK
ncbi:Anaphase-promoting complex subunit 8 [Spiromyces aspiralis]|uniref:Anaphase-promoting complex subunit 8 n=1 Tax=Spiromyces aspiralis TaxID=68401 RepID=A0ACC1HBR0_9FUNG|nr:Anaphase-promoting complex subunit 8 [Spiromyces aspiralis]